MNPLILELIPRYGTLTFQVVYYTQLTPKILLLASLVGPKADLALPTQRLKDSKTQKMNQSLDTSRLRLAVVLFRTG